MTEQALENAGNRAGKLLEESGFSEDLKKKLQERIEASSFKAEHASAFAQANMPVGESLKILYGTPSVALEQPSF